MSERENCIGCIDYHKDCKMWTKGPCPCELCLIKSMCMDTCKTFNQLADMNYNDNNKSNG